MSEALDLRVLGEITLFHGLSAGELSKLNSLLHAQTFPPGAPIINADQPGEVVYIIREGTVKIHVDQVDGTNVILAILGTGEVVGEMSVVDSLGRSATVVTQEECLLLWIDRSTFWECLRTMPAMTYNLTRILSRRLRLANEQIQALASLDVYGRVARQILAFAEAYGTPMASGAIPIPIRLTQSDLAGLVGASRVRVNQVLVDYREHGYISADQNHRVVVHDRAALARRCQ